MQPPRRLLSCHRSPKPTKDAGEPTVPSSAHTGLADGKARDRYVFRALPKPSAWPGKPGRGGGGDGGWCLTLKSHSSAQGDVILRCCFQAFSFHLGFFNTCIPSLLVQADSEAQPAQQLLLVEDTFQISLV